MPGDECREIQQARDERGSSQWGHDDVLVLRWCGVVETWGAGVSGVGGRTGAVC